MSKQKIEGPLPWTGLINKNRIWSNVMTTVAIAMIVGGATGSGYFLKQRVAYERNLNSTAFQNQSVTAAVSRLMVLPNEQPILATVTNDDVASNVAFYAKATAGDVVLYYSKAKQAILYDPETNRILEVAYMNEPMVSGASTDGER